MPICKPDNATHEARVVKKRGNGRDAGRSKDPKSAVFSIVTCRCNRIAFAFVMKGASKMVVAACLTASCTRGYTGLSHTDCQERCQSCQDGARSQHALVRLTGLAHTVFLLVPGCDTHTLLSSLISAEDSFRNVEVEHWHRLLRPRDCH